MSDRTPDARPLFRKLALGVAVICFVLAAVFTLAAPEEGSFPWIVLIALGIMMLVIGATGYWPPRSRN